VSLKIIVGIIVGIIDIYKYKTYILQYIQLTLYFLPFRPNIVVKRKANHCFQWLAFFVLNLAGGCMIVHQANNNKKSCKARANYPNGIFTTSNDASALHLF